MVLIVKQKLYRTKRTKQLAGLTDVAASIYNHCIALQKRYYDIFKKYICKNRLQAHIAKIKTSEWKKLNAQAIQDIVERIDRGYKRFFKKDSSRPPTFRSSHKYKSLTYKQNGWRVDRNRLTIQGIVYRFHKSRELGVIKRLIVKRDCVGDWYVCFVCEIKEEPVNRVKTGQTAGFDFGLKTFLTSDSGEKYESSLFYKRARRALAKAARQLSKKAKGSNRRRRARVNLARVHRKIANQRLNHHFKLARELALKYDIIFIEDLCLKGMVKLWGRKVHDLGFAQFVQILKWMCNKLGSELVVIDRFYPSSKTCSVCGCVNEDLRLEDREWTCSQCETKHNRDGNAAINIKRVGASTLRVERVRASSLAVAC